MASAPPAVHRLTRAEYDGMIERGAFEGLAVELLDGYLVDVSPQGPEHAIVIQALTRWLAARADLLRVQLPLAADALSEPEPDVALVEHDDATRHPASALLVVEVAVSAQAEARYKAAVYARAGVPQYWIVDVPGRRVFEHLEPGPGGYARRRPLAGDDPLRPPAGIVELTVAELFRRAGLS